MRENAFYIGKEEDSDVCLKKDNTSKNK